MQTQSTWLLSLAVFSLLGTAQARTLKPAADAGNPSDMGSMSIRPAAAFQHSSINSSLAGAWLAPGNWPEWDVRTQLLRFATSPGARPGRNAPLSLVMLRGYVFEDVNYGGGPGRDRGVSGATPRQWAVVELYDNAQNFLSATMTDASGRYEFPVTPDTYTVRVVNSTVTSSRPGYTSSLQAVQTYNGTTTRVGGENPSLTDAPANSGSQSLAALTSATATPESLVEVNVAAGVDGPDFGFNFDLVVNTTDSGQGSLRQFILNANALGNESLLAQVGSYTSAVDLPTGSTAAGLAGVGLPVGFESSIFMIPAAQLTAGVAVIAPATALPQLTGTNTAVNGSTQTFNIGNTNNVLLGTGGTVGTAATPLSQLNGPEVELVGSTAVAIGLDVAGAGSQVQGLAVHGFGSGNDDDYDGNLVLSASNLVIADNAIGSTATSFVLPTGANGASNVRVPSGAGISFTHNLIGFADGTGIYLASTVTGTAIVGNEIRGNARVNIILDGIDSHGSSTTVTNNLLADGAAQGFDSDGSAGGNVVTGNTFTSNGEGNATSAPAETAAAPFLVRVTPSARTFLLVTTVVAWK